MFKSSAVLLWLLFGPMCLSQFNKFGVIYPAQNTYDEYCCVHFPKETPIKLYDEPDGQARGILVRYKENDNQYTSYRLAYIVEKDTLFMDYEDIKEVDYEMAALTFTDRKNGYIKVLSSQGGLWLNEEDLHQFNYQAFSYQDFLHLKSGQVLGLYPEFNINLRASPSIQGQKIETLGFLHEISLTSEHNGQWSKVKVVKLKEERCEGGDNLEAYELEGWIKVIDDDGNLNIWYYTRGC